VNVARLNRTAGQYRVRENQVLPEVSEKSRTTIHGTVRTVIKVHVDTAGSVSTAQIASGGSRFFANAALDAAKQWDFAPAKVDGHAVASEWLLHFDFTPTGTKVTPLPTKP
jgi:TonB family protein